MEKRGKDHIRDGERGKGSHPGWGKGKRGMSGKNGKSSTSGMEKWGKVRNSGFRKKGEKDKIWTAVSLRFFSLSMGHLGKMLGRTYLLSINPPSHIPGSTFPDFNPNKCP